MAAQYVPYRLIGHLMTQVGEGANDLVVSPAGVLSCHPDHQASTSAETGGRPGYCRCLEPSNFWAINLRYQARIVSGFATQATSWSALRPRRLPISGRVTRSGLESRTRAGNFALKIRFSAARYSFRASSSWFTEPVT
jgi:hypothetical protein